MHVHVRYNIICILFSEASDYLEKVAVVDRLDIAWGASRFIACDAKDLLGNSY